MNLTDTTTAAEDLDGGQLDALALEPVEREPVRPVDLAVHAGAVLYQARALTLGDVLDCGAGLASALEDLAAALTTGDHKLIKGAALELAEIADLTAPHRDRLDHAPPISHADPAGELYPRGIEPAPPRRSHADRRAPFLGSVELMATAAAEAA